MVFAFLHARSVRSPCDAVLSLRQSEFRNPKCRESITQSRWLVREFAIERFNARRKGQIDRMKSPATLSSPSSSSSSSPWGREFVTPVECNFVRPICARHKGVGPRRSVVRWGEIGWGGKKMKSKNKKNCGRNCVKAN